MKRALIKCTDSLAELFFLYGMALLVAAWFYAGAEGKPLVDSVWWAIVTSTTTGYGDMFPVTLTGRIIGTVLMFTSLFLILPLTIVRITSALIENPDHFTDAEQRHILDRLDQLSAPTRPWVICNANGDRFRAWDSLGPVWIDKPENALKFWDRASAEAFAAEDEDAWRIIQAADQENGL